MKKNKKTQTTDTPPPDFLLCLRCPHPLSLPNLGLRVWTQESCGGTWHVPSPLSGLTSLGPGLFRRWLGNKLSPSQTATTWTLRLAGHTPPYLGSSCVDNSVLEHTTFSPLMPGYAPSFPPVTSKGTKAENCAPGPTRRSLGSALYPSPYARRCPSALVSPSISL